MTRKAALGLLLSPALGYPAFYSCLVSADMLFGDRTFLSLLGYDRRLLWDLFWSDYLHALPWFYLAAGIFGVVYVLARRLGGGGSVLRWTAPAVVVVTAGCLLAIAWSSRPGSSSAAHPAVAPRPHIWIVGGGPRPEDSGAQIEANVRWGISALEELAPDAAIHVYFANGLEDGPSVQEEIPHDPGAGGGDALLRVFGDVRGDGTTCRRHRVPDVVGSTSADVLGPALADGLSELGTGDQALIVYNGHGTWEQDRGENALRLWGESRLSVRQFEALLSRADPAVPVRFVFTQCFSGAFERAVHPGAADVMDLAPGSRCGFFAESEDRESEGCSASLAIGEYRDYTTYFLAALSGTTRQGERVGATTDLDGDGRITPFEAHLYALAYAQNGDLPRSTSEVFLERWEPWYVRWLGTNRLPDNEYGRVSQILAERNGFPTSPSALGRALQRRRHQLTLQGDSLRGVEASLTARIETIQSRIRADLTVDWPDLEDESPVGRETEARFRGVAADARTHPLFSELIEGQNELVEVQRQLIAVDRDIGQIEKLRRTRHLARLMDAFTRLASRERRSEFDHLRSCEELPIAP